MFSSNEIHRIAHDRIERFHHEARVEASLRSLRISYRVRIAGAFRRIATWIEPQGGSARDATPRGATPQGARYASE